MNNLPGFACRLAVAPCCLWLAAQSVEAQVVATDLAADAVARDAIEDTLQQQVTAWNQGNLEGFMDHYWKSDQLTFSAGGAMTRGWQATLDRYRQRYPDRSAMGHLTFDRLEIRLLDSRAALVLGNWQLRRPMGPVGGNFSLVMQPWDGQWVIVHDHTSVLDGGDEANAAARD